MPQHQRVTIKHVAKDAGVSIQTVSRVLNERPDVAPETRQRVLQVIESLGYQPSALARSLIQRRSYTLGVVTAGLKFIGPSRTLHGITDKAEELGYNLLLKELPGYTANNIQPLLQSLLARQVDGIIWAVPEIGDNRAWVAERIAEIPVPIIFLTMQVKSGLPAVLYDNYAGGCMATQHLIDRGHQRIGHLAGPLDWWEARQRKQGWQDVLTKANLIVEDRYFVEGNWSSSSGEQAIHQLLDSYPEMDAVFVANDQMALSVLQVACRKGLRVPQDLAVVGFDDIAEAAYFWPSLTTVRQDQYEMGRRTVQELVQRIEVVQRGGVLTDPYPIILTPQLIIRESS
jgi:LacI family transcriptional regulator